MYSFMHHIIAILLLIITIKFSNAQVINTQFYRLTNYEYKNNSTNVSQLLNSNYIKAHFIERSTDYRLKLRKTRNLIQLYYNIFSLNINNHNTTFTNNTITFNAVMSKNINYTKPIWVNVDNYAVSVSYKFHIENKVMVSLSLSL